MKRKTFKAITTKEIRGSKIPTIPIGTEFEIITVVEDSAAAASASRSYAYAICKGLPVTAIWEHEYKILE